MVGQVLIYSLHDNGHFEWWHFVNDPCSLYADDIALFLPDMSCLSDIIVHINFVGSFTGLQLNLDKTIAFNASAQGKLQVAGVAICNSPVKYLGASLGLGDLSRLNFETLLRKARALVAHWNRRSLTLDARILVVKTFIFSVFVHVLNTVHITSNQLDIV